jgi:hypothetical protein
MGGCKKKVNEAWGSTQAIQFVDEMFAAFLCWKSVASTDHGAICASQSRFHSLADFLVIRRRHRVKSVTVSSFRNASGETFAARNFTSECDMT